MKDQENYLGKRVRRGLFKSSTNKTLNADINGAIGIARQVFSNAVQTLRDSGTAFVPVMEFTKENYLNFNIKLY